MYSKNINIHLFSKKIYATFFVTKNDKREREIKEEREREREIKEERERERSRDK